MKELAMPYTFDPTDPTPLDEGRPLPGEPERRRIIISEAQMNRIAEKAADLAVKKVTDEAFKQVGKQVISKILWMVGVLVVAAWVWYSRGGAK